MPKKKARKTKSTGKTVKRVSVTGVKKGERLNALTIPGKGTYKKTKRKSKKAVHKAKPKAKKAKKAIHAKPKAKKAKKVAHKAKPKAKSSKPKAKSRKQKAQNRKKLNAFSKYVKAHKGSGMNWKALARQYKMEKNSRARESGMYGV